MLAQQLLTQVGMGKHSLLSAEVSRGRALLAGGASGQDVLVQLRQWLHRVPMRGPSRPGPSVLRWSETLASAIRDGLPLGAPVGRLLRESHPMIRREERHWTKQKGIERQFAFQGAIAVVLPWAVAGLSGDLELNGFMVAGVFFQVLGLLIFSWIVRRSSRCRDAEKAWVFEFLVAAWMRTLAGMSLHAALESALKLMPAGRFRRAWENWFTAQTGGAAGLESFAWPQDMEASASASALMHSLLRSGAPAGEALADHITQLDDERQAEFEERIGALPSKLSLVFCAFLTPAVFLILLGALWPGLAATQMM